MTLCLRKNHSVCYAENEIGLILSEPHGLLHPLAILPPIQHLLLTNRSTPRVRCCGCGKLEQTHGLVHQSLWWYRVEDQPNLARLLTVHRLTGGDHFNGLRDTNQARQSLSARPTRNDANFRFRKSNLCRLVCGGQS